MRIGFGYDVHRLESGRAFVIGGVEIPFEKGLAGHSDADVLTHAVIDALLGAAALGDIGCHFPDSDAVYAGISSLELLRRVLDLLHKAGWQIINVDATVVCEQPKIGPYRESIRTKLAAALGIAAADLNVKATTNEGLGFVGDGSGVVAYAVALLRPTVDTARP